MTFFTSSNYNPSREVMDGSYSVRYVNIKTASASCVDVSLAEIDIICSFLRSEDFIHYTKSSQARVKLLATDMRVSTDPAFLVVCPPSIIQFKNYLIMLIIK